MYNFYRFLCVAMCVCGFNDIYTHADRTEGHIARLQENSFCVQNYAAFSLFDRALHFKSNCDHLITGQGPHTSQLGFCTFKMTCYHSHPVPISISPEQCLRPCCYLTEHFTTLEHSNPSIDKFYLVQKRRSADSNAPKLRNVSGG